MRTAVPYRDRRSSSGRLGGAVTGGPISLDQTLQLTIAATLGRLAASRSMASAIKAKAGAIRIPPAPVQRSHIRS